MTGGSILALFCCFAPTPKPHILHDLNLLFLRAEYVTPESAISQEESNQSSITQLQICMNMFPS